MPSQSLLEEYASSCGDSLLERTIKVYEKHRYEGKEELDGHLTALFTEVLRERLNAEDDS
jgi:hypothetical protein